MSHHSARFESERDDYGGSLHDSSTTTVFISNINYSTTRQQIKEHLRKAEGIVRIEIFKDSYGNSKGYGLIEFDDAESADAAIHRYNDSVLNERNMKMRKDNKRKSSPVDQETRRKVPVRDPSTTIFIHNLDYNVTWQKLKDVFKVVGHVVNAEMLDNRKGAGIVQFTSQQDAVNAIAMYHGQMLMDRPMQVRMDSRASYQPDPLELRLSHIQGRSGHRAAALSPSPRRESRDERVRRSRNDYQTRGYEGGHRARSRSPVYRTRRGSYSPSPSPPPRYAAGYRNKESYGSPLSSDVEEPHYSRPPKAYQEHEYTSGHRGERRHKRESRPSYSPSPPPAGDYHGQEHITSVFIKNLPYSTTWQKLKDVFRKAGQVRRADIKMRDGRPSGLALVFFTSHKDAVRAIGLFNDTVYEGRRIVVQLNLEQDKQREQQLQYRVRH